MRSRTGTARIGRRRRRAGWVAVGAGGLVAVAIGVSAWWQVGVRRGGWELYVSRGGAVVTRSSVERGGGFYVEPVPPSARGVRWLTADQPTARVRWNGRVMSYAGSFSWSTMVSVWTVMLWPVAALLAAAGAALLRSGWAAVRRARADRCAACGYDLTGLAERGACPECGAEGVQTGR